MSTVQQAPPSSAGRYETFVDEQLWRVRTRIRLLDLAAAGLGFLVVTLGYGLAMLVLDKAFELPSLIRQAGFALYALGALIFLTITLGRVLFRRINPLYAAQQVEHALAGAKNSVVNYLDLRDQELPPAIRGAVSHRAARDLARADLDQAVSARRAGWLGSVVGGLCLGLFVLFFLGPPQFMALMKRAFAPFVETTIATRTQIAIVKPENGACTVSVGHAVKIVASVSGRVPESNQADSLRLQFRYQTGDPYIERPLDRGDERDEWQITVPGSDVQNGFWYRVAGGDAETPEYRVQVRSNPLVESVAVHARFRPYLNRDAETTREPNIEGLRGTEITLTAHTNRKVRDGLLEWVGETKPLAAAIPSDDPQAIRFHFVLEKDATYRLRFTSVEGESNADPLPYTVKVRSDNPPHVVLTKPGKPVVELPSNGMLALEGTAQDDFGIASVMLRTEGDIAYQQPYRPDKALRFENGNYPLQLDYKDFVDFSKVKLPNGQALQPGMEFEYWLEVTDNGDYPGPNVGKSERFKVKIAAPDKDQAKQDKQRQDARQEQQRHNEKQDQKLAQEQRQRQQQDEQRRQNDKQDKPEEGNKGEQQNQQGDGKKGEQQNANGARNENSEPNANQQGKQQPDGQAQTGQPDKAAANKGENGQPNDAANPQQGNKQGSNSSGSKGANNAGNPENGNRQNGTNPDKNDAEGKAPQNRAGNPMNGGQPNSGDGTKPNSGNPASSQGDQSGQQAQKDQQIEQNAQRFSEAIRQAEGNPNQNQNDNGNSGNASQRQPGANGANQKPGSEQGSNAQPPAQGAKGENQPQPKNAEGPKPQGNNQKPGTEQGAGEKNTNSANSKPENGNNSPNQNAPGAKGQQQPGAQNNPMNGSAGTTGQKAPGSNSQPKEGASGTQGQSNPNGSKNLNNKNAGTKGNEGAQGQPNTGDKGNAIGQKPGNEGNGAGKKPDAQPNGQGQQPGANREQPGSKSNTTPQTANQGEKPNGSQGEKASAGEKGNNTSKPGDTKNGSGETQPSTREGAGGKNAGQKNGQGNRQPTAGKKPGDGPREKLDPNDKRGIEKAIKDIKEGNAEIRKEAADKLRDAKDEVKDPHLRKAIEEALAKQQQSGEQGSGKQPGDQKVAGEKGTGEKPAGQENSAGQPRPGSQGSQDGGQPGKQPGAKGQGSQPGANGQKPGQPGGSGPGPGGNRTSPATDGPPDPKTPGGDPNFQKRAGNLQLDPEFFKKKVTPDMLKKLNMTDEQFQEFLKGLEDYRQRQQYQAAGKPDKATDPKNRGKLVNLKANSVKPTGQDDKVQRGTIALPPPEYRDDFKEFTEKLSTLERDKK